MARPLQAAIDTISITGADEAVSIRKLEEHAGDLNQAVNAHFSEGDTTASTINQSIASVNHDDMELDGTLDNTFQRSLFPEAPRDPFALMDPNFQQILFDRVGSASTPNRDAQGSHPREAPIEVKDSNIQIGPSGQASVVENVSGHGSLHDPEFRETIIIDDDDEELSSGLSYIQIGPSGQASVVENVSEHGSLHDPEFHETIIIDDDDEELSSGLSYIRIGPGQASVVENVSGHGSLHDPEFRETIIIDDDDEELSSGLSYIQIGPSGQASVVKNVSGHGSLHDPEFRETIIIDHDDEELSSGLSSQHANIRSNESQPNPLPTAPPLVHVTDNDIEEEMIRAAIEASKIESAEKLGNTAEQEWTQHLDGINLGDHFSDEDMETAGGTVRRQELVTGKAGTSTQPTDDESSQEETDDVEDQPLVRRRSRRIPSGDTESAQPVLPGDSPPSSSQPQNHDHQYDRTDFPSEWGGISSEEHDEAVMLEVALFGGIPEAPTYPFSIPSHGSSSYYPQVVHSPPPKLTEQRLLREQQDDEYLASLKADQEKEMKTLQEAELRQLEEAAAREAALEKRKQEEEERRKKQLEKEELESNLATKQASLPLEPPSDKEGVITLVVHMPDGSRQGRRFLKSDKLQSLFDFLDVGRTCRPGTYRLVRSYPRRAFTTGDGDQSFSDLGLTSKQEALFIEQITD